MADSAARLLGQTLARGLVELPQVREALQSGEPPLAWLQQRGFLGAADLKLLERYGRLLQIELDRARSLPTPALREAAARRAEQSLGEPALRLLGQGASAALEAPPWWPSRRITPADPSASLSSSAGCGRRRHSSDPGKPWPSARNPRGP